MLFLWEAAFGFFEICMRRKILFKVNLIPNKMKSIVANLASFFFNTLNFFLSMYFSFNRFYGKAAIFLIISFGECFQLSQFNEIFAGLFGVFVKCDPNWTEVPPNCLWNASLEIENQCSDFPLISQSRYDLGYETISPSPLLTCSCTCTRASCHIQFYMVLTAF